MLTWEVEMKLNTNSKSLAKVQAHLVAECFNKLFVGGQFVDPIDGEKLPTYYPARGSVCMSSRGAKSTMLRLPLTTPDLSGDVSGKLAFKIGP
jgi:hypothetical protein